MRGVFRVFSSIVIFILVFSVLFILAFSVLPESVLSAPPGGGGGGGDGTCPDRCDGDWECQDCCDDVNPQYCGHQGYCEGSQPGLCVLECSCLEGECGAECDAGIGCPSDGCYNTPCPGCEYRDYYCNMEPNCDCGYTAYDPDATTYPTCINGDCCTGCGLAWLSGGWGPNSKCCGDDAGESWNGTWFAPACCINATPIVQSF
ncbi:MAG: hypothetical protein V3U72_02860, partial [Candidatus Aenigmarchaeota archaeon]